MDTRRLRADEALDLYREQRDRHGFPYLPGPSNDGFRLINPLALLAVSLDGYAGVYHKQLVRHGYHADYLYGFGRRFYGLDPDDGRTGGRGELVLVGREDGAACREALAPYMARPALRVA